MLTVRGAVTIAVTQATISTWYRVFGAVEQAIAIDVGVGGVDGAIAVNVGEDVDGQALGVAATTAVACSDDHFARVVAAAAGIDRCGIEAQRTSSAVHRKQSLVGTARDSVGTRVVISIGGDHPGHCGRAFSQVDRGGDTACVAGDDR